MEVCESPRLRSKVEVLISFNSFTNKRKGAPCVQQVQYPVLVGRTEIHNLMNSQRKNNNKQSKNQKRGARRAAPKVGILRLPRSVDAIMPDRFLTTLRWWKSNPVNLLSTPEAAVRVTANGAFDPDPTSGATVGSGYRQLASIYGSYRVKSSRIRVEVMNPDPAVPVTVIVCPTNIDPGSSPTSNYIISLMQQPYARHKMLAVRGCPTQVISHSMSTQKIFGSKMTDFDDNFAALNNANPNNPWFWVIGFYAPAIHTVSAVVCNIFIEQDIEFYDRYTLNNSPTVLVEQSNEHKFQHPEVKSPQPRFFYRAN